MKLRAAFCCQDVFIVVGIRESHRRVRLCLLTNVQSDFPRIGLRKFEYCWKTMQTSYVAVWVKSEPGNYEVERLGEIWYMLIMKWETESGLMQ